MTLQQKHDLVKALESRYRVTEWSYDGLVIWPLIRSHIHFFETSKTRIKPRFVPSLRTANLIIQQFVNTVKLMFGSSSQDKTLIVTNDTHIRAGVHNLVEAQQLRNGMSFSDVIVFEYDSRKSLEITDSEYPVFHRIYFFNKVIEFLCIVTPNKKLSVPDFTDVVELSKSYGFSFFDLEILGRLSKELHVASVVMQRILRRWKVKCVLFESYYSKDNLPLVHAASQLGIQAVDWQHGVQGSHHLAYGNYSKISTEGYSMLPNEFWTWNQSAADQINKWAKGTKRHVAKVVGHQRAVRSSSDQFLVERVGGILYTLQPIDDPLPESVIQVIKGTISETKWWFRLHPSMLPQKAYIQSLLSQEGLDQVDVERMSQCSLDQALIGVDMHLTLWSSCVIEAYELSVPSIIMHEKGELLFKPYLDKNEVYSGLVHDPVALIKSCVANDRDLVEKNR